MNGWAGYRARTVAAVLAISVFAGLVGAGPVFAGDASSNGVVGPAGDDPPITPNSGWHMFSWPGGGQPFNVEGPFTFTSATPAVVSVTDAFCRGDAFRVYDNNVAIGDTSSVPIDTNCTQPAVVNADAAYSDTSFSHGSFLVPAGSHSITIQAIVNPQVNGGGGYLRVDACTVFGSGFLQGTASADVICGSAGADQVLGLAGDDLIFTFAGNDSIRGGDGNDRVYAGDGNDSIVGDAGNDRLDGQEGDDKIAGGLGNDTIFGGTGADSTDAGAGTDACVAEIEVNCES